MEYTLHIYETKNRKRPFSEWLNDFKDIETKTKIRLRLDRLEMGNFGSCRSVGEGVFELKIDFGPGYRIYYALIGKTLVLLLCGGSKRSQDKDIKNAKEYFLDYKKRKD